MSESSIKIPRLGDRAIAAAFEALEPECEYKFTHIGISTMAGSFGISSFADTSHPTWTLLLQQDAAVIYSLSASVPGFNITFYRGGNDAEKSAVFDEIKFSVNETTSGVPSVEVRLKAIAFLTKKLKAFEPNRSLSTGLSKEAKLLEAIHQTTLDRLERLGEDVIRKASETREQLELKYFEKIQKNEEELANKKAELESQYNAEREKLQAREDQFHAKLKEIDDRDNTHVRRAIRDKMLDDVKDRINNFGVSGLTAKKRLPVMVGILVLGMIFFTLLALNINELQTYHKPIRGLGLPFESGPSKFDQLFGGSVAKSDGTNATSSDSVSAGRTYFICCGFALLCFRLVWSPLCCITLDGRTDGRSITHIPNFNFSSFTLT